MRWQYHYSLTFEYPSRAPQTHRGVVEAAGTRTALARAVDAASEILQPSNWSSLVICVLDRVPCADADVEELGPDTQRASTGEAHALPAGSPVHGGQHVYPHQRQPEVSDVCAAGTDSAAGEATA